MRQLLHNPPKTTKDKHVKINWKGLKVLITGVTGLIGSNLARELHQNGAEIYSIDNFSYIDYEIMKSKFDILDYIDSDNIINFKLLALDYSYSPSKISKAKKQLREKGLLKSQKGIDYLNPLI